MKKNEKTQLLFRKIKQLNLVISGLSKENNERDKQIIQLKNKYDPQIDSILNNYSKKMEKQLKSFIGQQQYFIRLFQPDFQLQVESLKAKLIEAFHYINSILLSYEQPLFVLKTQIQNLTLYISDLLIEEDEIFDGLNESLSNRFDQLREIYLQNRRKIDKQCQNQVDQLSQKHNQIVAEYSELFNSAYPIEKIVHLYRLNCIKDLKDSLSNLTIRITDYRTEIKRILNEQSDKMKKYRKEMNNLMYSINSENIEFKKEQIKLQTQISNLNNSEKKKTGSFFGKIIFNKPKNKQSELENENDITKLKAILDDTKRNNQREVFQLQYNNSNEKNAYLKLHAELISLITFIMNNSEYTRKIENEYKEYQLQCQNEIENAKQQLDSEYLSKQQDIDIKSQVRLSITAKDVFNKEAKKYEEEFHQLQLQLTPKNQKEQRQFLRADAILPFVEAIEYENKRHSLLMSLFDLHKSSRLTINNCKMDSLNAINLLREEIKREIKLSQEEANPQKTENEKQFKRIFSSSIKFDESDKNEEKARIAKRMIRTSEGTRKSSNELLKKHGKERAKLLESYENIIRDLQNQKMALKNEMSEDTEKFDETMKTMKYKYFSLVETYQQLSNTEKEEQAKAINKINKEYDERIARLNKTIEQFKTCSTNQSNPKIEAQIDKLNWKCELLNSQLVALTRQLRTVHSNQMISKNPNEQISKLQKRIKSSLSIVQNNQIPH